MKWLKWIYDSKTRLFLSFWLLLFIIYIPAWRAGFVSDFTGWLYDLQNSTFSEHINRTHFKVKSLYQFTQLVTWFFYQLFGINHFLWHCLHISLHALNVSLLFFIVSDLYNKSRASKIKPALWAASVLFCISPTLSEVIVWEASFHYLLGFLLFLLSLRFVQLYRLRQDKKWIVACGITYFLSTFSIELFYITPICVLALILFSLKTGTIDKKCFTKSLLLFVVPQCCFLLLHFILVKLNYGHWLPHISSETLTQTELNVLLSKPLQLLFHLLFFGRFFSQEFRDKIYAFCESYQVIISFYSIFILLIATLLLRLKRSGPEMSLLPLLLLWAIVTLGLNLPLWFPKNYWVVYDRYAYFSMGIIFIIFSVIFYQYLPKWVNLSLFIAFAASNLFATYKVNKKWCITAHLTDQLMKKLPQKSNKKVLLLNMPHFMNGLFMIPGNNQNEACMMRNLLYQPKINYELIDVCANNIVSVGDGAHVRVLNDSTVSVMLNQNATWYWFNDMGAADYHHRYFTRKMLEYSYSIILKGNPSDYTLLYQVGDQWKEVHMDNRSSDQY